MDRFGRNPICYSLFPKRGNRHTRPFRQPGRFRRLSHYDTALLFSTDRLPQSVQAVDRSRNIGGFRNRPDSLRISGRHRISPLRYFHYLISEIPRFHSVETIPKIQDRIPHRFANFTHDDFHSSLLSEKSICQRTFTDLESVYGIASRKTDLRPWSRKFSSFVHAFSSEISR